MSHIRQMIVPGHRPVLAFDVGDWIRLRLAHHCDHFHTVGADSRIGMIRGVVTAELLARDNALATDPRDVLTLDDFGDHIYSVDFIRVDALDGELCSASEMERLPTWATINLTR